MRILLIGLGSIGRRHLGHLEKIDGLELAALRTKKGVLKEEKGIKEFYDLNDALDFNPDGVLISNPTSLHVETAIPFLEKGIRVLIEKPIDTSVENAERLRPYSDLIRIAYCMRFHPVNHFLKNLFDKEVPFKVGFKRSFYLPKWHPYADYRKEYTAQKALGGGVIRTLSHEIDLSLDWFGEPSQVSGVVDKVSFLELDTDDYAFFTTKTKDTILNFELDFFSPVNVKVFEAFTNKGKYEWGSNDVFFTAYEGSEKEKVFSSPDDAYTQMYQDQMVDFCRFASGKESLNATLEDGINVLKIIEQVENR
ncbi:Gfo/Idh/MocA family oxidoreductase [Salegentibacter sp. F188]|uniref:Gfo/Idh/MocA family oxidoreductase n=1 Tax=Autumnicola patrickiae TaxID=3075591 RepID=A0ABU3E1F9_9FLAO|nr:Gfo/Idh/MocA family oxidoreductase [Salegentibacter sp. F188]MDT0689811.1 Gfo/Idh/MocA family oxidoreductase [Salegentibacter sp. F188]